MTHTTYCQKHDELEFVDEIVKTTPFLVERKNFLGLPERTGASACEVQAVTDKGCKVHFIGGPQWNR